MKKRPVQAEPLDPTSISESQKRKRTVSKKNLPYDRTDLKRQVEEEIREFEDYGIKR